MDKIFDAAFDIESGVSDASDHDFDTFSRLNRNFDTRFEQFGQNWTKMDQIFDTDFHI